MQNYDCRVLKLFLLTPTGSPFSQNQALEFSKLQELILVCGRYEGIDQRVSDLVIDHEVSIGDYVLMGGEVAAMVIIEATVRLIDNVIGNSDSIVYESFAENQQNQRLLEAPHYTRPPEFRGMDVPQVLLSGDHEKIRQWRHQQSIELTQKRRPDLVDTTQPGYKKDE